MIGGDLDIGEDEMRMLELAQQEDDSELDDIENLDSKLESKQLGKILKKRQKPVTIGIEDELEYEYEREDLGKSKKKE